jgi:hypothetical protein
MFSRIKKQSFSPILVAFIVGLVLGALYGLYAPKEDTPRVVYGSSLLTAEIPASWSFTRLHDGSDPASLFEGEYSPYARDASFSVSGSDISYGDMSGNQIDVFEYWPDARVEEFIGMLPDASAPPWGKETVDGLEALVLTEPLDNGESTKAGTGGKTYYIVIPEDGEALARLVIIRKQALGEERFEKEFEQFLRSIQFAPELE